jgi:hypothetical protein
VRANDIYAGRRPEDVPAYSLREAAELVGVAPSTLRSWVRGRTFPKLRGQGRSPAVIRPPSAASALLSFTNVVEAHVLSGLRRKHELKLDAIRTAVRYVHERLKVEHPLAMEHDVAHDHGRLHSGGSGGREHTPIAKPLEALRQRLCRSPPLVRDEVAGDVGAALDREHQVEAHQIERVLIAREILRSSRTAAPHARDPLVELGQLAGHQIPVNHPPPPPAPPPCAPS